MSEEIIPDGVLADGNGKVLWVPAIADLEAPTVAECTATGVFPITYSFTPDGFSLETTVNKFYADRLHKKKARQYAESPEYNLRVSYVAVGTEDDEVRTLLVPGTRGFIVYRPFLPNDLEFAVGQPVLALEVECGIQEINPPTDNAEQSIGQNMLIKSASRKGLTEIAA